MASKGSWAAWASVCLTGSRCQPCSCRTLSPSSAAGDGQGSRLDSATNTDTAKIAVPVPGVLVGAHTCSCRLWECVGKAPLRLAGHVRLTWHCRPKARRSMVFRVCKPWILCCGARGVSGRIVDVNCGTYATFAITSDDHIFAFGLNNYGQLALPGGVAWP